MENGTLVGAPEMVGGPLRVRILSVVAALALVLGMFVLVQDRADAAPAGAPVAASVASVGNGSAAQINFAQFVCPTLLEIRVAFAGSPFFSFVLAAIDPLLAAFGCLPSGA